MRTVTEHIRRHALEWVGVHDAAKAAPSIDELRMTEWAPEFERLMRNRLVVGGMRYARFNDPRKGWPHRDNWAWLVKKLELYEQTGNAEYLVDIANYAMVLWRYPQHPNHHFAATDRVDAHHAGEGAGNG